ncbi:MAG: galactokinase [bacterium]|nr:galactokinase [bacterium]
MDGQKSSLINAFKQRYPSSGEPRVCRAPGRTNLIGEHTDYNLGFVLPVALEMACYVASAPSDEGKLRVYSANVDQERVWGADEIGGLKSAGDWSDYVAGVAVQLVKAGYAIQPASLYIHSTVPEGGGLSSSAALEVSAALALLSGREMDKVELAKLARAAEVEFVGMPCGIMDQYISVFGQENAALKIDCRSLEFEVVKLPEALEIVATNTMVKHELGGSAYRDRVAECQQAVDAIRMKHPEVESLRDATLDQLDLVDGVAHRRARHVIGEDQRVEDFVAASAAGNLDEMGRLFVASHRSLQHDYEVSCEELDALVDTALTVEGVYGSRMSGGGFGGCTVTMMAPGSGERFRKEITESYRAKFNLDPQFYPCKPSQGAGEI